MLQQQTYSAHASRKPYTNSLPSFNPIPFTSLSFHYYTTPNGFKTLSLATRFATSAPLCSATAPIIAYTVLVSTTSTPDPSRLFGSRGFQRRISRAPSCVARFASRFFVSTVSGGVSVRFWRPVREGCVNGVRVSAAGEVEEEAEGEVRDCVDVARGECKSESVTWRLRMRRPGRRLLVSFGSW